MHIELSHGNPVAIQESLFWLSFSTHGQGQEVIYCITTTDFNFFSGHSFLDIYCVLPLAVYYNYLSLTLCMLKWHRYKSRNKISHFWRKNDKLLKVCTCIKNVKKVLFIIQEIQRNTLPVFQGVHKRKTLQQNCWRNFGNRWSIINKLCCPNIKTGSIWN